MKFNILIRMIALMTVLIAGSSFAAKIRLLPHQQRVVSYLNENPQVHGLILYHALGAGKTITSLSYAKQQSLKTVVLVPKVLKAHWITESSKVGVDSNKLQILSYNDSDDIEIIKNIDFSKNLVVVDEIQKLVEQIRHTPDTRYLDLYWNLFKTLEFNKKMQN